MANDKGGRLGFSFAQATRRGRAAVATMQKLVRKFMGESGELFGSGLAGKQHDFATARHAPGRRDRAGVLDGNALGGCEPVETLSALSRITLHDADVRQFLANGLADIEHVCSMKSRDRNQAFTGALIGVRFTANDRSQDQDAFLTLLDEAAEFVPPAKARDMAGVGPLRGD